MSVQAVSWVLEHCDAALGARCLMFALANHADENGENCWASVSTLARESRLSRKGVQLALRRLEADGEITPTGRSQHGTTIYALQGMKRGAKKLRAKKLRGAKLPPKNGSRTTSPAENWRQTVL